MRTCSTIGLALLSSIFGAIACTLPNSASARPAAPTTQGGFLPNYFSPTAPDPDHSLDPTTNHSGIAAGWPTSSNRWIAQAPPGETPPQTPAPASPAVTILTPQPGSTGERTTSLVVRYPVGTQVQVLVNQTPIAPTTPTQVQEDTAHGQVTQVWYNLPLRAGVNTLTVQPAGGTATSVQVTVKETAARLLFLPASNSRIPADGRSTVTVEGQIVDDTGALISRDAVVTLTASAGKFVGADQDPDRPGFQVQARGGKFTAQLQSTLAPQKVRIRAAVDLSEAKSVPYPGNPSPIPPIRADNNGRSQGANSNASFPLLTPDPNLQTTQLEAYTEVEFITNLRSPIVSGVINLRLGNAGTDFYGSFRDFLRPDFIDDGTRLDVSAAVFATGRVGDWLITGALNNQRPLNQVCDGTTRLFRDTQFCDQVYPVYGDSSTTDYLTPSIDSVYFKLERTSPVPGAGSDFFMWGDYSTPELATGSQFYSATNRQLHGFKGNYNFGNLQLTAFYANNIQGFQRDTIAPNGTSGYYFLSRRLVIGGSENVFIETEELNRPGTVVERKQLFRGPDYEIDYDRGALLFRRPILQIDFDLFGRTLVRRIVITYQYDGNGDGDTKLYAGRLQYNFSRTLGLEGWAGVSYLNEDQSDRTFELYGIDTLIPLGKEGRLIAEFARSMNDSIFRGNVQGNAYRFEATGPLLPGMLGRAYYRSVEENFANNATFSFTPGQTRYGAELAANLTKTTQFQFQYDHEENFGIAANVLTPALDLFNPTPEPLPGSRLDNSLTTIRAGVQQKLGKASLGVEWVSRNREDRATPSRLTADSDQIVSRLTVPLSQTLTFRAQNEQNISSQSDPLYPDRTTFGIDWAMLPGVTMRLAQQFSSGGSLQANSITSLDTIVDQKLSDDTTLTGRYSILNGINGLTSQGAIGLNHRIVLSPGLRINLAYERIFGDIFAYTAAGQQFAQPYAPAQSSASVGVTGGNSYSVGVEYTDNPDFKATARVEYRDSVSTSVSGNNLVISAAAAGKLSPSLTMLGRFQQANYANQLAVGFGDTKNIKLGLAYRNPYDDKFNALLRYEYRQNPGLIPDTLLFGSGTGSKVHLMALEAIYAPNWRWEFYGKFALRDTRSYSARDLIGTNAITLGQLRATYRLGYRWDVGGEVRWIGQSVTSFDEVGLVLEAGYYLTPNLRLAAGYSFGQVRDRDFGDRSKGSLFVGLTLKLNELFEGFGLQKITPPQQQESRVQPVSSNPGTPQSQGTPGNVSTAAPPAPSPAVTPTATVSGTSPPQTAQLTQLTSGGQGTTGGTQP